MHKSETWNSVTAKEQFKSATITDSPNGDYRVLQHSNGVEFSGIIGKILLLPATESWHMIITFSVILNYMVTMYCNNFVPQHLFTCMWIYVMCDIIYLFNLILVLLHCYSKKLQQKFQIKPTHTFLFIIDVISLLPQESILGLIIGYQNSLIYYCRYVTFLRLYRIWLLFAEILKSVRNHRWAWFLVQYIILYSMALHTAVCIWFSLGCIEEHCKEQYFWTSIFNSGPLHIGSITEWYLICLYVSVTLISNTGFGDFYATNFDEGFYFILVETCGFMLVAVLIAVLTVQLVNLGYRKYMFAYKLENVKKVIKQIGASPELLKQVLNYYEVLWRNKSGISEALDLYNLPNPLRMELMYDINIAHLQNSLLFKTLPEAMLRKISLLIKHIFLLPGDVFFYQGVVKNRMVFIASGVLEILSEEDDQSPIISFKAGTVLGEVALLLTVPAKATVRAAVYTELQIIERQALMRIISDHPDTMAELRNTIKRRLDTATKNRFAVPKGHVIMNMLVSNAQEFSAIKQLKDHLSGNQNMAMVLLPELDDVAESSSTPEEHFSTACLPLYRLTENVTMIEPPCIFLNSSFPWILDPRSTLIYSWNLMVDISQIILCLLFSYFIIYKRQLPNNIELYGILSDAIYLFNIYIQCTTAVVLRNRIIKQWRHILNYRMNFLSFYIDVFSLFPIEVMVYAANLSVDESQRIYYLLQLNRILRIWRLHKIFQDFEKDLSKNILAIRIMKYTIYLVLFAFWAGALLYLEACMYPVCTEDSWFYIQMAQAVQTKQLIPCYEHPETLATYFGANTLFLVGYGDVLPNNDIDIVVVCILMLFGIFIVCFCTAQLCATFALTQHFRQDFQENVFSLGKFLEQNNLMRSLYKRVIFFFRLQWAYDKGTGRDYLFNSAPSHLRSALQSTELKQALSEIPLFQLLDQDFLLMIAEGAKVQVLPSDEIITYAGDMSREMYIILNGHCQMLSDQGTVLHTLCPGAHFGMLEMIYGFPKRYTTQTITNCKLISVDYRTYMHVMGMFPSVYQETKEVMEQEDLFETVNNVESERLNNKIVKPEIIKKKKKDIRFIIRFVKRSFILTKKNCKLSDGQENYWEPFQKLGKFRYIGYFLLPIAINPQGPFIKVWCAFRAIIIMMLCMVGPFYISTAPYGNEIRWYILFANLTALLDIYLLLHMGYYNEDGLLITHPKDTALYYLKHNFAVDLLGVFPIMMFVSWENPNHNEGHDAIGHLIRPHLTHCSWHLNVLIQFHRIPELLNYMEKDILQNAYLIRFFKFIPLTLVLINLAASLMFSSICNYRFYTDQKNDSASEIIIEASQTTYYGYLQCKKGTWHDQSSFSDLTGPLEIYLIAIYWVTSTFMGVGVGDVTAFSQFSIYVIIITIIVGRLLFAYVFASLATGRAQFSPVMSEYHEELRNLMSFVKRESVDYHWQRKLFKYYEYVWKRTFGVRAQELTQKLNTALMEDTVLFLYEKTLREVPLFENVERSFIRVIAKHLTEQYFQKGDTVMRSYDIHNNIYIIYRGKVEILSSYNEMIACMGPGGIFGNIRQVSPGCSSISIVATRNLDVLVISNETFYNVIKEYPRIMRNMGNIIQTATDYIMPTTIIEDEEYEGNPIDMLSDLSSFTKDAPDSNALGKRSDINSEESPVKISSSFGTSHATHMSESGEKWVALKAACNICLPCKWFRFAILPDNLIIKITSIGVLCISFYDVLYISYNFVTQNNNLTTLFITLSLEIIFYFKILLSFHETYMDRFGNYVTRFKKLSRSYFKNKTRVFWDIVPNLPVEPFCVCFTSENRLFALSALRMIHLLRLQYILSYFKMVNGKLLSNLAFNQILKIAIFMFITIHFFTCGWMMIASPFNEIVPNSWITVYNFTLYTPFHRYCVAAYYIINIGTTTGTGDIFPNSLYEISYTIFVILLCKFLTALIVGDLVSVINLASRSLVHYENRIHRIQYFLRNQSLSGHQMEKLWNYLRNLWTQEKGEHIPIMMKSCPYVMRCDIMTVMFGQHLRNSFLFHGVNSALVRQLAACLNRMIFFTGNYIVQDGDTDQNMYFIHSGEVSVLTVHANLTETQHELLKREDMFGLAQGLYHGLPHHFSYRANTTVSILALNLDSWYHMLKYFPKDKDLIYYRAQHVYATV